MNPTRRTFLASAAAGGAALLAQRTLAAAEKPAIGGSAPVPLAPPDRQLPNLPVPEAPERKARWAIVGLGELALGEILPAFAAARWSQPVALVSGHPEKARKVAGAYGLDPHALYDYESFNQIAADSRIDIVYIVLPNSMHAEFTERAFRAGKHVFCEKPMATTTAECERMIAAARAAQLQLGIAYRLHYEPLNRRAIEMCAKREIGALKTIESSNCQNTLAPNIRLSAALGGGPVGDIGIYSINAARSITGEEPIEVMAMAHWPKGETRFREVPESVAFTLRFPSGVLAHCDCSFGSSESRRYRIHGSQGWIEMDPAFSYRGLRLRTRRGDSAGAQEAALAEITTEPVNQFAAEMDHFSGCVLQGHAPRTPGEMGLADVRIIAAINEAARTGQAIQL